MRQGLFATTALGAALLPSVAFAAEAHVGPLDAGQIAFLSAVTGVVGFAVVSAIALIKARTRADVENARLRLEISDLKVAADRAEALVNADDQRFVAWGAPGAPPLVVGGLPRLCGAPDERSAFLAFGTWLAPGAASCIDAAIERLRSRGEGFTLALDTASGAFVEAAGRTSGGRAVVRFRDLSGDRLALAELEHRHRHLVDEVGAMRALLDAAPMPAWVRNQSGALEWVNPAFVRAVEAKDADDAIGRGLELLDTGARADIRAAHEGDRVISRRLPAIVAGNRRIFDVVDVVAAAGSAGIASDATETETLQAQMKRLVEFHARTLDQLATAVAIFGPDKRLRSYNAAYRALFNLDASFLDSAPDEGAVLDRMRAARKLPEQADFRSWRAGLLGAYQALEAREHWWHLPDGQTLRVIANPHPQGGMTWVYENVTERLELESRYNALSRVQGETLDHLQEAVAVFGSDGRLRLDNPAFTRIWGLDKGLLAARPHVSEIERACRRFDPDGSAWSRVAARIAGLDEGRAQTSGRMERIDGRVIDYAMIPLPDGQTMVTFVDITDTVQVERALIERNEALEAADRLKNTFIQHVSYELRAPLTNIIGFAQLLTDVSIGPLTEKQRDYTGYILSSSATLLTIINDILDLATVDAGIITLEFGPVDIAATVAAAIDGVQDRVREGRIRLETKVAADIGGFVADGKRIRQILYNLVSNAVGFSSEGGWIGLTATRRGDEVEFVVADEGAGIPPDFLKSVFERFESRSSGNARGGAGLGLAIVKSFVELHGGTVAIDSEEGRGTKVTVRLPLRPEAFAEAAE